MRTFSAHTYFSGDRMSGTETYLTAIPIPVIDKYHLPRIEALFVLPKVLGIRDGTYWPA